MSFFEDCKEALASFVFPSRCLHCEEEVKSRQLLCLFCSSLLEPASFQETGSLNSSSMEPEGPCLSILKAINGPYSEEIAKTMAAFMVVALNRLGWAFPDVIIPSPRDVKFNRLLAKCLSDFLHVPVIEALKMPMFFHLDEEFRWKGSFCLSSQRVLVIDSKMDFLADPYSILDEAGPAERRFLSFC